MSDSVDWIDAALGCQQCGRSLESSVDADFCSESCQRTWRASRVGAKADLPFTLDTDAVMGVEELHGLVETLRTHLGAEGVEASAADDEGVQRGLAEIRENSEPGVYEAVENIMDAVMQIRAMHRVEQQFVWLGNVMSRRRPPQDRRARTRRVGRCAPCRSDATAVGRGQGFDRAGDT